MSSRPQFSFPGPSVAPKESRERAEREGEPLDLPAADEWRELFERLHSGLGAATYSQRAARLSFYGWEPADLARVCSRPREAALLRDAKDISEEEAEALAALAREAVIYYSNGLTVASSQRTAYMARLAEFGWAQTEVGKHVGLTKQRVQKLMKDRRRQQPKAAR